MTPSTDRLRAEIGVCLFLIVACAVVLWESRDIPPGSFEPLGSAPIPQAAAIIIILLSVITVVRAFQRLGKPEVIADVSQDAQSTHNPRIANAITVLALTIVYCLVLHSRLVVFSFATVAFLFLAIGVLVRFKPRSMVVAAVISLVMGFGTQYVFTKVFVVDLPGAF